MERAILDVIEQPKRDLRWKVGLKSQAAFTSAVAEFLCLQARLVPSIWRWPDSVRCISHMCVSCRSLDHARFPLGMR